MNSSPRKDGVIALVFVLILLALVSTLFFGLLYINTISITGKISYSEDSKEVFTKALCNEDNYCRDYIYTCENGNLISITATRAYVQHSEDWKDTRSSELKFKSCNS